MPIHTRRRTTRRPPRVPAGPQQGHDDGAEREAKLVFNHCLIRGREGRAVGRGEAPGEPRNIASVTADGGAAHRDRRQDGRWVEHRGLPARHVIGGRSSSGGRRPTRCAPLVKLEVEADLPLRHPGGRPCRTRWRDPTDVKSVFVWRDGASLAGFKRRTGGHQAGARRHTEGGARDDWINNVKRPAGEQAVRSITFICGVKRRRSCRRSRATVAPTVIRHLTTRQAADGADLTSFKATIPRREAVEQLWRASLYRRTFAARVGLCAAGEPW